MAELAQFRATIERFEMEPTHVIMRKDLARSNEVEWRKINENFNTVEGLISQSVVQTRDQELQRIRSVFEDMLSPEAISGPQKCQVEAAKMSSGGRKNVK